MRKKVVWLVISGLMALSLVITACAQAPATPTKTAAPTTAPTTVAPTTTAPTEKPVAAPTVQKPKYGGVLKIGWPSNIDTFDEVPRNSSSSMILQLTNEELWRGDWTKGPAGGYGSNEADFNLITDIWELNTGFLAESWEIPHKIEGDTATIIWHIRKGVRWSLNPNSEASRLVNGREVTADDIAFSLKRVITVPQAYLYTANPEIRVVKITTPDKWTVKMEFPWDIYESAISRLADFTSIVPPEVVQKYGNMNDWKVSVGTGPFMLTDYISDGSATFVRNPNYWMKDPIGPGKGNQLPYLDGLTMLFITDKSTLYAALRTAKVDWTYTVDWEQVPNLKKSAPQLMLKEAQWVTAGDTISMRTDKKPFDDIRVRRAMFMAIDFEGMKNKLFGGNAQIITWPIKYYKEYASAYLGLDDPQMPESVKELYSYKPEKAKQLLKEAGYPNGFKTWIDMGNTPTTIDYFSVLVDYWSKVGIQVELRPVESTANFSMRRGKKYEQMMTGAGASPTANLYKMIAYRGGLSNENNVSVVDDPYVNMMFDKVQKALVTSRDETNRLYKEHLKYVLDQAWTIPALQPPQYTMWWPWIKNYSGELILGYNNRIWPQFIWLDQELKKSMGY